MHRKLNGLEEGLSAYYPFDNNNTTSPSSPLFNDQSSNLFHGSVRGDLSSPIYIPSDLIFYQYLQLNSADRKMEDIVLIIPSNGNENYYFHIVTKPVYGVLFDRTVGNEEDGYKIILEDDLPYLVQPNE